MTKQIYPCLWFDGQAKAAAEHYCSIFKDSKITAENPIVVTFELKGPAILQKNRWSLCKRNYILLKELSKECSKEILV